MTMTMELVAFDCPVWLFWYRKIDGPGLPGGLIIHQGHVYFP